MTNRRLSAIVKDQSPAILPDYATLREACCLMASRSVGSVLVVDGQKRLSGIISGRDAVRALSLGLDPTTTTLGQVMTKAPVTIGPTDSAIDALRLMWDGGFRHLPVVDGDRIVGVISRGDFKGMEIDRMDLEQHLWETMR